MSDSTVPMAASTVQGRPGQVGCRLLVERQHGGRDRRPWRADPVRRGHRAPPPGATTAEPHHRRAHRGERQAHAQHQGHRPLTTGHDGHQRASRRPPTRCGPPSDVIGAAGPWQGTVAVGRRTLGTANGVAGHTWTMQSTMQDAPLLISDILRHGQQVHGDSTVITVEAGRSPLGHVRRGGDPGREAGGRPDPARASSRATGSGPSAGTTRATWRRTSPSPPWGRSCTPSTSGSRPSSWPTSSTTPRTASSSSTPR